MCGRPLPLGPGNGQKHKQTVTSALPSLQNITSALLTTISLGAMLDTDIESTSQRDSTAGIPKIWNAVKHRGGGGVSSVLNNGQDNGYGIVIFSNKHAFHRPCFDLIQEAAAARQGTSTGVDGSQQEL